MKRFFLLVVCILLLFSGCVIKPVQPAAQTSVPAAEATPESTPEPTPEPTPSATPEPEVNAYKTIRKWWYTSDYSFIINSEYRPQEDMSYTVFLSYERAEDESFHYTHIQMLDEEDVRGFYDGYFRYEDDELVAYEKNIDGTYDFDVASVEYSIGLDSEYAMLAGPSALMPSYITDLKLSGQNEANGNLIYTYNIPLDELVSNPESYIVLNRSYVFPATFAMTPAQLLSNSEVLYAPVGVNIKCSIEVEEETYRPVRLLFDFEEYKPYVLSEERIAEEKAKEEDYFFIEYSFNYDLPETITIPEDFLQAKK